jgi:hypothetical protein
MPAHPEERRIAGLLRELIVQSRTTLEDLETRLEWDPGRLTALLDGRQRLSFQDILEVLPVLGTTPSDFFAWLYGFDPKEASEDLEPAVASSSPEARLMDRRFEASQRVVRNAIARRLSWKRERDDGA